jgi:sulfur carrier protein
VIVHVNGRRRDLEGNLTVGDLVDGEVPDRRGVAVAIDGELVPRSSWDATDLVDGVQVEIVGAVQGG